MSLNPREELYQQTMTLLRPALQRVATDAAFRERFEQSPLAVLDELGVPLDSKTRAELEGRRFSEFWAARRKSVEGPVETRDLPPEKRELQERELAGISGGTFSLLNTAPPYVPVGSR